MAATFTASLVRAPVACNKSVLKPAAKTQRAAFVSNGTVHKTTAMMVWTPLNNKVRSLDSASICSCSG